jgi:hypothetical protein
MVWVLPAFQLGELVGRHVVLRAASRQIGDQIDEGQAFSELPG